MTDRYVHGYDERKCGRLLDQADALVDLLHPLRVRAGLADVRISPRMVDVDGSRPDLIDGFTRKTSTCDTVFTGTGHEPAAPR